MPFYVLLLRPKVKKFELIQFSKNPEKPSVESVMEQTMKSVSNPDFKAQEHIGFFCPSTHTQILLPKYKDPRVCAGVPKDETGEYKKGEESEEESKEAASKDLEKTATEESANTESETKDGEDDNNDPSKEPVQPKTEVSSKDENNSEEDENPFARVGQILVAIPKDVPMKKVEGMSKSILSSASFQILTQGNSIFKIENTSTSQELAKLEKQGVAKDVTKRFEHYAQESERSMEAYQKEAQDLEERRKKRLSSPTNFSTPGGIASPDTHGLSPVDAMRVAQNQQRAAARQQERATLHQYQHHSDRSLASPDTHGLSPLDAMRVAQNQQKAAARQQERETLQHYQRHSDTSGNTLGSARPSSPTGPTVDTGLQGVETGTASANSPGAVPGASPTDVKDFAVAVGHIDDGSAHLYESSAARQKSLRAKKDQELESIRQRDGGSVADTKAHYMVATSHSALGGPRRSVSERFSPTGSIPSLQARRSSFELGDQESPMVHGSSLQAIKKERKSTSQSELEQLRGLGLTKSLKNQFTDSATENQRQTEAYRAQAKDLEERKAKTGEFRVSRNAPLSAADASRLSYSKWKKEDRIKEREALGYYQSYKGEEYVDGVKSANDEWKTTGKVHTSENGTSIMTKEWEAPKETDSMHPAKPPVFSTTHIGRKMQSGHVRKEGPREVTDGEAKQGCACTIM